MSNLKPFISSRVRELSEKKFTRASGALLLSDISGFTAISEALGGEGKEGTEQLSYLLDDYFCGMLGVIRKHGGEVIKFCGDSLLIAFYHNASEDVVRACAREMMEETERSEDIETCAGNFSVSMKVVGKSGEWNELLLGNRRRREHFLCGKTIREIMSMEDRALSGETVIEWERGKEKRNPNAKARMSSEAPMTNDRMTRNGTETGRRGDREGARGRVQTKNGDRDRDRDRDRGREWERSFLPQGVAALVDTESFGEHRAVTTAFLNLRGYDEENPETKSLQRLFREVISITEKYGGVIHDIDSHAQGSNIMILFGAPTSHENDAERAVMASMELSELNAGSLKARVGVSTGFVYAGVIGSDWRKEYAVMGDAVNTAERLMETARNGKVIVSGATQALTLGRIEYRELKSTKAKGKEEKLTRFTVLGLKEEEYFRFKFVGRERETETILQSIDSGGKAIIIKGGAGIGKSRLLHEIGRRIEARRDVSLLQGYADDMRGPLHSFASMIAREAKMDDDDKEDVRREKLEKHIREIERGKQTEEHQIIRVSDEESRLQTSEKTQRWGDRKSGGVGDRLQGARCKVQGARCTVQGAEHEACGDIPNSRQASAGIGIESGELYKRIPFLGTMLFGIKYPDSLYEKVGTNLRFENLCDAIRYYIEYQTIVDSPQSTVDSRKAKDDRERGRRGEKADKVQGTRCKAQGALLTTTNYELRTTNSRVVVVLDNFHSVRKDALKIVEYITRALLTLSEAKNEITFIFSGRPEPDVMERLRGKVPVLPAGIDVLELELLPLTDESIASLSSTILKDKPLPEEVAEAVFRRTEGNPFYLEYRVWRAQLPPRRELCLR
jgi:class 3 adenylate cyclase